MKKILSLFLLLTGIFVLPLFCFGSQKKPSLDHVTTFANTYKDYTSEDLQKLKRFGLVIIEPYNVSGREFLEELKKSGTLILAYISIGEADEGRRYWKGVSPPPPRRRFPGQPSPQSIP